ncbi:MAG: NAD(P)-binding domain-containing protein [Bifidobacterium adolescentis]
MSAEANVGVVGLAAMGGSLARNLAHHGNKVAVFNHTYARTEKLMNEHGGEASSIRRRQRGPWTASSKAAHRHHRGQGR